MTTLVAPAHPRHSGKSGKDRMAEGEAILADWSAGARVSEMCEKYGVSTATLYRRRDAALAARLASTVDQYRERENVTLDEAMAKWQQQLAVADELARQAMTAESTAKLEQAFRMRSDALAGILRVSERRAKLNGLDAPAKAEVTVTHTTPVDAAVEALVAQVEAVS